MEFANKNIGILAENNYQELELWYPLLRFREAGANVKVIGINNEQQYKSKLGYPVKVDLQANQVSADDFAAIIVPGGYAPDLMRTHPPMVNLVREALQKNKVVAAICHAGWVLISAGILRGKKVTGYYSIKDDLINAGANYVDEAVVRDGNLITSRMPSDLPVFCKTILEALTH